MLEDFSNFEIEDFAFHESFQDWVVLPASKHRIFWERYLATHLHQTDRILAARELVRQLKATQQAPPDEAFAFAMWQNIQRRTQPKTRTLILSPFVWRVAAASVLLIVGLGTSFWWLRNGNDRVLSQRVGRESVPALSLEEVNRTDKLVKVHLGDGSVVSLGKNSRLSYPKKFATAQRVVSLSGEAFFEVKKNPDAPFLVYANETVTKVLGTSFHVKAYDDAPEVTVKVKTGRVSVFVRKDFEQKSAGSQRKGVVLMPNQKAIFLKNQTRLTKTLADTPDLLVTVGQKPSFDFNNTPLLEVFGILERAYGVEIIADTDLTKGRSLTVSMEDESLFEKLDVICKTLNLDYQIVDAKIIVEGRRK